MRRRACLASTLAAAVTIVGVLVEAPRAQSPSAHRIVSLVPATTEMLFAMQAGDRLVGVGSYDRFPPEVERIPRVGGLLDPDVERILALKPDLVIIYATQAELRRQLERAAIPRFVYVHRGLADVIDTIRRLGDRVGVAAAAARIADRIEQQLAAVRARVAGRPRPGTVIVFGRETGSLRGIEASGGYGFLHDMLTMAGGTDLLADIRRESVQMTTEMMLARAPEAIVELRYGAPVAPDRIEAERHVWDRLSSLPAVRQQRVYFLVGDEFVVPGPRVAIATERLARALHPEAFR